MITGTSDTDWEPYLESDLGADPAMFYEHLEETMPYKYKLKNVGTENEKLSVSAYSLRLKWLRMQFNYELHDALDDEIVAQYTRGFCMDLFGSVMFPDSTADGVPAMYLQFISDLETPRQYNWGGAVLAYLYRELSRGCLARADTISGPMLLLQMWSWTRFSIGRPTPRTEPPPFGGADEETRPAFAVKWVGYHLWPDNPHSGGTPAYRDQFERLTDDTVNWQPYVDYYRHLPRHVRRQKRHWLSCRFVTHFWMVEWLHADRVMRQFGLHQEVPPPPPLVWDVVCGLRDYRHDSHSTVDGCWAFTLSEYIHTPPVVIRERRHYDMSVHYRYMQWFRLYGVRSVFVADNNPQDLGRPLPPHTFDVASLAYVPHGHMHARTVARVIQLTQQGIYMVRTPGLMLVGKNTLENARDILDDIGQGHIFRGILDSNGLPTDLHNIDVTGDVPDYNAPRPECADPPEAWDDFFAGGDNVSIEQFMFDALSDGIRNMGPSSADPGPSTSAPQGLGHRRREPSRAYTPGSGALRTTRRRRH